MTCNFKGYFGRFLGMCNIADNLLCIVESVMKCRQTITLKIFLHLLPATTCEDDVS